MVGILNNQKAHNYHLSKTAIDKWLLQDEKILLAIVNLEHNEAKSFFMFDDINKLKDHQMRKNNTLEFLETSIEELCPDAKIEIIH